MTTVKYAPNCWEAVADALAQHHYCCIENYLDAHEVKALLTDIENQRQADNFKKAGIGADHNFTVEKEVRGDYIKWISPDSAAAAAQDFLSRVGALQHELSKRLFIALRYFECHYAIYPPGTFYEKHVDQFKNKDQRIISMACYLNPHWQATHGGALRIYTATNTYVDFAPLAGRLLLFRSDTVAHEVLSTQHERFSITGWLRNRPLDIPFL